MPVAPQCALAVALTQELPEDQFDRQPLQHARYALVGDIRIDNREDLERTLGLAPAEARRTADSELFLSAWERWGKAALDRVLGGFAVAIWDEQEQELTLVRDHPGERPVYYLNTSEFFAFASLPSALRGLAGVDTSLDEDHLLHYLALAPAGPDHTFFRNIHLLPPAHVLTLRHGEVSRRRYWHPMDAASIRLASNREYEEQLLSILDVAVQARLRTTGKVGSQLSGGLDSSSVTAAAARLLAPQRLTAFTAVPQADLEGQNPVGRFGNEGPAAARLAAMYSNVDHVLVQASQGDLLKVIEETGSLTDTAVFNPINQMWLNSILDRARDSGIRVMLQGVCGNATISMGGLLGLADLVQSGRWLMAAQTVRALRAKGHTSWRGGAYAALGPVLPLALRKWIGPQTQNFDFSFSPVHPERARELNLREKAFEECFGADSGSEAFKRKMVEFYDAGFANAGATLGWGISLRDPTQDKRVFEFCCAIPYEQYLAEGQTRSLVRRSMRDRLPPETLACTTRGLQGADWFLTVGSRLPQLQAELHRIAESPTAQRVLDLPRLQRLLDTWPSSGYESMAVYSSWHMALMRGISAGNFIRHFESA